MMMMIEDCVKDKNDNNNRSFFIIMFPTARLAVLLCDGWDEDKQ